MKATAGVGFLNLPARAWARIQILFFALVLAKGLLMLMLRKHLYEIHWRVADQSFDAVNLAAFYVFIVIGLLSLVELARHCRSIGVRAVRSANLMVVCLGLLFIFFTFHTGDKKYLYPVITGVLKWHNLGPYLILDLFFRPPYLAVWLAGYGLAYAFLAWRGWETYAFYLTVACAGAYAILNLQELVVSRNELLIVDCLGLACLLVSRIPSQRRRLVWLLAPVGWTLAFAGAMFYLAAPHEATSMEYFIMLLATAAVAFALATVCAWRRGFLAPWSGSLLFYFAAFLLLTNTMYLRAENYNNALCLGLQFPHYFMGEFAIAVGVALCAALYCRIWPRAGLWWLDLVSLALITAAFIDLRLSQIMGVRLGWDLLMFGDSPKMMWRMARPYLPGVLLALGVMVVVYALAIRGLEYLNRNRSRGSAGATDRGPWYAVASFVLLGGLGLVMAWTDKAEAQSALRLVWTSPLWKTVAHHRLPPEEFVRSAQALGLGDFSRTSRSAPSQPPRDLNVVLVFMESSYNKHLSLFGGSEETQPLLSKYKDRMELFPNFFSNFAGSIQARFAAFTSLYPVRDFNKFTRERIPVKSVFEALHDHGYASSLFYSSYFDYTGFRDFLRDRGIDEMYDTDTMPGRRKTGRISWGLREEETLGAMQTQITKYAASGQKFFLTYVPAAPHYPYDSVSPAFAKYKMDTIGDYTPQYLNELLYVDSVVTGIIDQLKESGLLDKTLVVITDDHGELTGKNGGPIGHGWIITPELVNAPLTIMDPEKTGYRLNLTAGSQIDLLPTILELLRIPLPSGQLYQGRSLYDTQARGDRLAYLNSYEEYALLVGDNVVTGSRKAEEEAKPGAIRSSYQISNEGSKTVFTRDACPANLPTSIRAFDDFQEGFLSDYSFYCESVLGRQLAAARSGN